jgi:hypothetical protein
MGSPTLNDENKSFIALRDSLASYAPISDETWEALRGISKFRALPKTLFFIVPVIFLNPMLSFIGDW